MNPLSPFECVLPTRGCSDPSYALAASLPGDRSHRSPSGESLCVVPPLPPSLFRSRPDGRFNPRAPPRAGHVPHSPPHSVSSPGRGGGSPSAAGGDDLCPHPISAGPHPSSGPIPPANSLCPLCRRGSISPVPFLHRCSYAPCSACPFCLREHAGLFLRALPMPVPFRPPWWGPRLAVLSGHKPVPPRSYFFDFVALSLCPNAPSPPRWRRRALLGRPRPGPGPPAARGPQPAPRSPPPHRPLPRVFPSAPRSGHTLTAAPDSPPIDGATRFHQRAEEPAHECTLDAYPS